MISLYFHEKTRQFWGTCMSWDWAEDENIILKEKYIMRQYEGIKSQLRLWKAISWEWSLIQKGAPICFLIRRQE